MMFVENGVRWVIFIMDLVSFDVQGGEDPQDALSLQVILRKKAL